MRARHFRGSIASPNAVTSRRRLRSWIPESLEQRVLLSTALPYGGLLTGNITNPAATSDYTFTAKAGDTIGLGMTSTPTQVGFTALADLYGPTAIKATSFFATGQVIFHPTLTGTYTLKIHDSDFKQTGSFAVALRGISPVNANATPLPPGGIVSGSISAALDSHEYTFTAKSGDIEAFSLSSTPTQAGFNAFGELYAPSGTRVDGFFAGGGHLDTLHETGTFLLVVHDSDYADQGQFTVGLQGITTVSPGSAPLVPGGFVSGTISTPIGVKAYTFTASTGNVISLALNGTATQAGFSAYADVFAPSGTRIFTAPSASPQQLQVHESGKFLVLVHDSDYVQAGTFTLGLEGLSPPSPDALALPAGQTKSGSIDQPNDLDQFTFFARAGDNITFTRGSTPIQTGFNALVQIYSPAGTRIIQGANPTVKFTVPTTGVYLAEVSDITFSHKGNYTLSATWTSPISSSISGNAYTDTNANGTRDTGEVGVAGRRIFLDANGNGKLDTSERSTTTDVLGNYAFDSLTAGSYVVQEVLPGGQKFTNPLTGLLKVIAGPGQNITAKNFGTTVAGATGTIAGRVFNDGNGNGSRDIGELGLGLWTVYIDSNNNGVLDTGESKINTDINGTWSFKNLVAGSYVVRIVQLAGTVTTSPGNGALTVQLASGQGITTLLFGEKATS